MRSVPLRVVVSGAPDSVRAVVHDLTPAFDAVDRADAAEFAAGSLWDAVDESLRRFDRRVAAEGRRTSFVSAGSTLDDWAALDRRLATTTGSRRDARFGRRYLRMHRDTTLRHARSAYDVILRVDDDPANVSDLILASGVPVVSCPTAAPAADLLARLEGVMS